MRCRSAAAMPAASCAALLFSACTAASRCADVTTVNHTSACIGAHAWQRVFAQQVTHAHAHIVHAGNRVGPGVRGALQCVSVRDCDETLQMCS